MRGTWCVVRKVRTLVIASRAAAKNLFADQQYTQVTAMMVKLENFLFYCTDRRYNKRMRLFFLDP